jgi:hypothetical protein
MVIGLSKSQTKENSELDFFEDLAVFMTKMPYAMTTIIGDIIKAFDEELNNSSNINSDARATFKYFLGKLVKSFNIFFNVYDKPVLRDYIINPGSLIKVSQAIAEALRAYHWLVVEDLSNNGPVADNIASALEKASALIESIITYAITELTENLTKSNCPQQAQSS